MDRSGPRAVSWIKAARKAFEAFPQGEIDAALEALAVFADFGVPDANMRQLRASLAAEVIKALDCEQLSTRAAEKLTGTSAADFSRIRNSKLVGFTADRLMSILQKLHREVHEIGRSPLKSGICWRDNAARSMT